MSSACPPQHSDKMSFNVPKMLIFLLLLLLNLKLGFAAFPLIYFPDEIKEPEHEELYLAAREVYRQAFEDAITLARIVVLTGSDCDPVRLAQAMTSAPLTWATDFLFLMH